MRTLLHIIAVIVFVPGSRFMQAQEGLRPLTSNPRQSQLGTPRPVYQEIQARSQKMVSLSLPFKEDFSYASVDAYPSRQRWTDSTVYINTGFAVTPPSFGVATFDGLNRHGYPYDPDLQNMNSSRRADTLTSMPINLYTSGTQTLLPSDSLGLIFFYQPRGNGDKPEATDSLMVDFYDPVDSSWVKKVWATKGDLDMPTDSFFFRAFIRITDSRFFHPEFRFRFRNKATTAGDFDHWHVDYIYLDKNLARKDSLFDDITFGELPSSLLDEYSAMPFNQYGTSEMTKSMNVHIRNNSGITASMEYDHNVYIAGTPTYTYPGGPGNLVPFHTGGYSKVPAHSEFDPTVYYQLAVPPDDSLDFVVKHYLTRNDASTEFIKDNDTLWQFQRFRNYFAYDDGGAESGYYVNGAGARIAVQFRINKTDTFRGLRIYFDPAGKVMSSYGFRVLIWQSSNSGPSVVQHSFSTVFTQKYYKVGSREMAEYTPDTLVVLPAGVYFIGIQQQAENVVIGFDRNYDSHTKIWYNTGSGWKQSEIPGSLMLRPVMGRRLPPPVGVAEITRSADVIIFPNPTSGLVTIHSDSPFSYIVTDMLGQVVSDGTSGGETVFDGGALNDGLYLISVIDEGGRRTTRKLVIRR